MPALSPRLQFLLDRCRPGFTLWDLCCDHGYLGLSALQGRRFSQVVFNDTVPHVLEDLRRRLPMSPDWRILLSPAEEIDEPLTGNVVLAGVGGEKIYKILCAHASRGGLVGERLILCPEKDAEWLARQSVPGFTLCEQTQIVHNHGHRAILVYAPAPKLAVV